MTERTLDQRIAKHGRNFARRQRKAWMALVKALRANPADQTPLTAARLPANRPACPKPG